jgi:glutathione S-transferase
LADRAFICGDRFTAADVYVGSMILWGTQFGTLPMAPNFEAYAARLSAREAYQRAKRIDDNLIAQAKAASSN